MKAQIPSVKHQALAICKDIFIGAGNSMINKLNSFLGSALYSSKDTSILTLSQCGECYDMRTSIKNSRFNQNRIRRVWRP